MFGLDVTTAIRYAAIARQLLRTPAEQNDSAGPREPKDPNRPYNVNGLGFTTKTLQFAGTLGKARGSVNLAANQNLSMLISNIREG